MHKAYSKCVIKHSLKSVKPDFHAKLLDFTMGEQLREL